MAGACLCFTCGGSEILQRYRTQTTVPDQDVTSGRLRLPSEAPLCSITFSFLLFKSILVQIKWNADNTGSVSEKLVTRLSSSEEVAERNPSEAGHTGQEEP